MRDARDGPVSKDDLDITLALAAIAVDVAEQSGADEFTITTLRTLIAAVTHSKEQKTWTPTTKF